MEDNGAHARLGYGSGHFFRSIKGQDCSGLDIVYQVWPEHSSGKFTTPFGYLDADFFYWGLAKMASSAAHIDTKKNGITVCEIFGAYGWQEGLKLMKWLTDHICVRGVNFIIPHAFSPKYPDRDCPPHFYARGANPQWRYFGKWSAYANRVCHLLTGGTHVAPVAVLYHAEAEWAGKYMPFEKVVKVLAKSQIDCEVVPIDIIVEGEGISLKNGAFTINKEEYRALIVPYSQRLPLLFVKKLPEYMDMGIQVIFIDDYPEGFCEKTDCIDDLNRLKENSHSMVLGLGELTKQLKDSGLTDIETDSVEENLRSYHYLNEDKDIFFFTNESSTKPIETNVKMTVELNPIQYDALEDKFYLVDYVKENGKVSVKIELEPYQSLFIIFKKGECDNVPEIRKKVNFRRLSHGLGIEGPWKVYTSEAQEYPSYKEEERIKGLGNVSVPDVLPEFSGTIRYETTFEIGAGIAAERLFLDLGRVYETVELWVNGKHAGVRICPPYCIEITDLVIKGNNSLCIDITNTLAKKHGDNHLDRAMAQEPSGLIGPVRIVY